MDYKCKPGRGFLFPATWLFFSLLFLSCATQKHSLQVGRGHRFEQSSFAPAFQDSTPAILDQIVSAFDKTTNPYVRSQLLEILPSDSQDTVLTSVLFSSMFQVLEQHELHTFTLDPGTYESVYALSQLPVVIGMITIPLNKANFNPLKVDRISSALPTELMLDGRNPHLRIVSGIERDTHGYWIRTADNLRIHGLSDDKFTGAVVPIGEEAQSGSYCQIVSHIVISALPAIELEGHLKEWYSLMPLSYRRPRVRRSY